jgi:arginyl-tRNA--protein-N-Asp/Glu arginylyltransferase
VVKYTKANKANIEILKDIFNKYFEYRNFKPWKLEPLLSLEIERKHFLIYYLNDEPIAFTFLRDVGENSVFSTQFAWNYENPKLYLGKYANLAEIDYCIANNKDYMYTGVGYEKACIYKSDYQGFQFWNGEAWSNNTEDYKWLCERDSKIEKTKDLDKIKRYDDKNFFIND